MALASWTEKQQKEYFDSSIQKEIEAIGQHFSEMSILHSKINKKIDSSKSVMKGGVRSRIGSSQSRS